MRIQGFTIVEILVAVLIGSVVASAVYWLWLWSFNYYQVLDSKQKQSQEIRSMIRILDHDIRNSTSIKTRKESLLLSNSQDTILYWSDDSLLYRSASENPSYFEIMGGKFIGALNGFQVQLCSLERDSISLYFQ